MLNALEVVTTVVVGVMVGVEFAVAFVCQPDPQRPPEDSGQLGRAHGGRMLGAVMPVWYLGFADPRRGRGPSPDGTATAPASSSPPARC